MTTMERLGSVSHRMRRFTFVDEIEEAAQQEEPLDLPSNSDVASTQPFNTAINVAPLNTENTDNFMRFDVDDEESQKDVSTHH